MISNLEELKDWIDNGKSICIARVIKTWGSSPRPIASTMLINEDGKMLGSVSGGCVEGDVVKKALELMNEGGSIKLNYGINDEDAWSVGLSCGGRLEVFLENMNYSDNDVWDRLIKGIDENKYSILISTLKDGGNSIGLIDEESNVHGFDFDQELISKALDLYSKRSSSRIVHNGKAYFIHVFPRKPLLIIIGVAHITVDLISLAKDFGFETIVIDPRGFFTQNTTFVVKPSQIHECYPSEVLDNYPLDSYTYAAILSHDPKIDDNALEILLKKDLAYIGALGSRKTHAKRAARLLERGFTPEDLSRISAPIGVSINARSAKEIALAIMAQIIEVKNLHVGR